MNPHERNSQKAFTVIELLIIVAIMAVCATVFVPRLTRGHNRCERINCVNNLKQVGMSFRTWDLDNGDKYPMQVSVTNGGTMELVGTGMAFMHFAVMSNELSTPKILFCPRENDIRRMEASTFSSTVPTSSSQIMNYFHFRFPLSSFSSTVPVRSSQIPYLNNNN